jgi:hypothetical protein
MSKRLKLVISRANGHKGGRPLVGAPARLVNVDTGEVVPGITHIQLNFPVKGVISCTAEIQISNIEFAEDPDLDAKPGNGESIGAEVEAAEAAGLEYQLPPLREQAEPGNGEKHANVEAAGVSYAELNRVYNSEK